MLYHLFEYLDKHYTFLGHNLYSYVSFRVGLTLILSILLSAFLGKRIIRFLQSRQIGEVVRDLGLAGQLEKKGTPTMGGIIILIAILVPTLLFAKLSNTYIILMLITTLLMGGVGFLDDWLKLLKKNKDGLNGWFKVLAQVVLGVIVGLTLWLSPSTQIKSNKEIINDQGQKEIVFSKVEEHSLNTTIPFSKSHNLDYLDLLPFEGETAEVLGIVLFILVTTFIVTLTSNAVNLTDGLDGLATGSSAIVGAVLGVLAYVSSHYGMARYLDIMFIPRAEELTIFCAAFVGATLGFLWYNSFPAQVFMGDTGSLALGGIIGVLAIVIRKELLLFLLCGVFFAEALSVVIQVLYFKYTRFKRGEGERVFRMTPIHHHYQKDSRNFKCLFNKPKNPIHEAKITMRFFLIGIVLAIATLVTLKIR